MKTKFFILMLAAIMVFAVSLTACAQDEVQITYDSVNGTVTQIADGQIYLDTGSEEIILNISEDAELLSTELMPVELDDIKAEMYAMAIVEPLMTMSIPAQYVANTVVVSQDVVLPVYAEVALCEADENGTLFVNSADGKYIFEVDDETVVEPFKTRNIVTKNDLSAGDRILVYADAFTKSIPAKAYAKKVVILENIFYEIGAKDIEKEDEELAMTEVKVKESADGIAIYVNDALVQTAHKAFVDTNDRTLIASDDAAKIFGLNVNAENGTAVFCNDKYEVLRFEDGKTQCIFEGDIACIMDTAPQTKDGSLYVPLRFMAQTMGYAVNYEQ